MDPRFDRTTHPQRPRRIVRQIRNFVPSMSLHHYWAFRHVSAQGLEWGSYVIEYRVYDPSCSLMLRPERQVGPQLHSWTYLVLEQLCEIRMHLLQCLLHLLSCFFPHLSFYRCITHLRFVQLVISHFLYHSSRKKNSPSA